MGLGGRRSRPAHPAGELAVAAHGGGQAAPPQAAQEAAAHDAGAGGLAPRHTGRARGAAGQLTLYCLLNVHNIPYTNYTNFS